MKSFNINMVLLIEKIEWSVIVLYRCNSSHVKDDAIIFYDLKLFPLAVVEITIYYKEVLNFNK